MDRSNLRDYTRAPLREHPTSRTPAVAEQEPRPAARKRRKLPNVLQWRYLAAVLLLAIVVYLAYGYIHTKHQLDKLSNPQVATQDETQQLVSEVGKLVQLPSGETPVLFTVNDASKLKSFSFFQDAQNGDKVLDYPKADKAVLYRPSANRVIVYTTVNLTNAPSQ
ncbi:MAG TPA: hypothetical protein VEH48_01295 [Candidatus Nitrosopolaris sp.]|nr:hypothetical protein [Candidatus Nitrosopolaris sp.]